MDRTYDLDHHSEGFIGTVDELGNSYKDLASATGLSRHLVLPILRNNNKYLLYAIKNENPVVS